MKEECSKLISKLTSEDIPKPGELLLSLARGGKWGSITIDTFELQNDNWAQAEAHGWNGSTATSVTIRINGLDAPGYWKQADSDYRAHGLIHELGHAYWWLFGERSTGILYDHPDYSPPGTGGR
jgi:hypothetical protein